MKNKLIKLSDQENSWIQEEADKREVTFTDMLRRIVDDRYESRDSLGSREAIRNFLEVVDSALVESETPIGCRDAFFHILSKNIDQISIKNIKSV